MADNTVTLAAVSGAHGVTGEVRLKLFAENLDSLKRYKSFNDGALTVKSLRPTKDGAIARFAEINDRNAAEKLRSTVLTVPREALPELGEGEYYYSDLLGLPCVSTEGTDLGKCVAVENFGASDVLEIEMPSVDGKPGKKFMVPMTADAVPEWGDKIVDRSRFRNMTFQAQILTLYPEMFPGPLGISLAGRALEERKWSCSPIHIRDFATDKHRTVDDTPAGGGAGMVLAGGYPLGGGEPCRGGAASRPHPRHDPARRSNHANPHPRTRVWPRRHHHLRPFRGL